MTSSFSFSVHIVYTYFIHNSTLLIDILNDRRYGHRYGVDKFVSIRNRRGAEYRFDRSTVSFDRLHGVYPSLTV